jgi:hypothetical protein
MVRPRLFASNSGLVERIQIIVPPGWDGLRGVENARSDHATHGGGSSRRSTPKRRATPLPNHHHSPSSSIIDLRSSNPSRTKWRKWTVKTRIRLV